jgi:CheY-like chemotaxis protein/two-component sensor histidine kinase
MLAYAGQGKTGREDVDLNELVREIADLLSTSVSKKTTLQFETAEDLLPIRGDPTQIRQIVMNLITNAAQAIMGKTGEITLRTEHVECDRAFLNRIRPDEELAEGTYVSLRVSDTGVGMTEATQERVFDPFFTTKTTGSGLGLSAVHGIVHSHRGAIKIESEPGKGTSFTVLFRAARREPKASETNPVSKTWRGSGTILVVDDEEFVRSFLSDAVKHLGLSVLTASNGVRAVEVFREHQDEIDGVILDLKMPLMDGEETFAELRRIRDDVLVILSSGFTEDASVAKFAGKGLAGFIQKPYTLAALERKLRDVLSD